MSFKKQKLIFEGLINGWTYIYIIKNEAKIIDDTLFYGIQKIKWKKKKSTSYISTV